MAVFVLHLAQSDLLAVCAVLEPGPRREPMRRAEELDLPRQLPSDPQPGAYSLTGGSLSTGPLWHRQRFRSLCRRLGR